MEKSNAYWVKRNTITATDINHIRYVIDNPEDFGITKDYILDLYAKYNERLGQEGHAREDIMIEVMRHGWIRLRQEPRSQSWIAQLWNYSQIEKTALSGWALAMLESKYSSKYDEVYISVIRNDKYSRGSMEDLSAESFVVEAKTKLYTFHDIAVANAKGDLQALHEASLGRAWQHMEERMAEGRGSFAILTSWRELDDNEDPIPDSVNEKQYNDLKATLRNLGLGSIKLIGTWKECPFLKMKYKNCPVDKLIEVSEPALLIPNITREDADKLGIKYNQDSWIYGGPETRFQVVTHYRVDNEDVSSGKISWNTAGEAYSKLKAKQDRTFRFVGFSSNPQSFMEALAWSNAKECKKAGLL